MVDFEKLAEAMGDLDEDAMVADLNQVMAEGGADASKAMEACQKGMDLVGARFEEGEYFVGDLIYAGELMTQAVDILKDALVSGGNNGPATKMILCTVDGIDVICTGIFRIMNKCKLQSAVQGIDIVDKHTVKQPGRHNHFFDPCVLDQPELSGQNCLLKSNFCHTFRVTVCECSHPRSQTRIQYECFHLFSFLFAIHLCTASMM